MKPAYLVNLANANEYFEIPADQKWRIIGRRGEKDGVEADFQIPYDDRGISRIQGEINYEIDGQKIHYKHLNKVNPVFVGTPKEPYQTKVYANTSVSLSFGDVLTMGKSRYQLQLRQFKEMEPIIKARLEETICEEEEN